MFCFDKVKGIITFAALLCSIRVCTARLHSTTINLLVLCYPMTMCVRAQTSKALFSSQGLILLKAGKESCCQHMLIFRLPSNCLLLTTTKLKDASGESTDYYNCVHSRGRTASICWAWGKHSPWKPPPSHQVSITSFDYTQGICEGDEVFWSRLCLF